MSCAMYLELVNAMDPDSDPLNRLFVLYQVPIFLAFFLSFVCSCSWFQTLKPALCFRLCGRKNSEVHSRDAYQGFYALISASFICTFSGDMYNMCVIHLDLSSPESVWPLAIKHNCFCTIGLILFQLILSSLI